MSEIKTTFGMDTNRMVKRVKWYNRESSAETIYEGQPVCYMFDTTNNILGYDKANSTFGQTVVEATTTGEGYQNEGKYSIVEKPYTDNLMWFAGVVAPGNWCGQSVAATSYKWIEIFVPNGAIVAVRTNQSTTTGITILSLISATQYLGAAAAGRAVALAAETVDRSSTNGLVLAKLDPSMFLYQSASASLSAGAGTTGRVMNTIDVTSAQTSGAFTALKVKSTVTAGGYANATSGGGLALWISANVAGTAAATLVGSYFGLNLSAGTPTEYVECVHMKLSETATALSSANTISVLSMEMAITDAPAANHLAWFYMANNGAEAADALLIATNLATLPATAFTGSTTINTDSYGIKVYLKSQPGTQQWYIPLIPKLQD